MYASIEVKVMVKMIQAKTLLSTIKEDKLFGLKYNMNLYRGCQHGCIYCDSRSNCYGIENFSEIQMKENALELLEGELRKKKVKGTIGTGSMNDPYMPVEKKLLLTRRALEIINIYGFPVHILTKSNLVERDIDILKKINKVYCAVSITITTAEDNLSSLIEPGAPKSSDRFKTIKKLSAEGIYTGILMMPILPFINDTEENIRQIVEKGKAAGAKYILPFMGMTLREGQREYYYRELDKHFPTMKEKYIRNYGYEYNCSSPNSKRLYNIFYELCKKEGIATNMSFYKADEYEQLRLW